MYHQLRLLSFTVGLLTSASAGMAAPICDLAGIKGDQELHDKLSRRSVEVVDRATMAGWKTDARLAEFVEPFATFSLGAGDVGRPLGSGAAGAHALAIEMHADTFHFYGWDYMVGPADSCRTQKITVEFIDSTGKQSSTVEFTFRAARIVSAAGWERSLESGSLKRPTFR